MSIRQTSFMKTTSSIGCVDGESNAPVDSNAGEPTRPCTSGIDCFGAEDGTSRRQVVPLLLYPKSSSVPVIACCTSRKETTACHPTLAELP